MSLFFIILAMSVFLSDGESCGYLKWRWGELRGRRLEIDDRLPLPQSMFTKVFTRFGSSSVQITNDKCMIEVCGYPTSGDSMYYGQCTNFKESEDSLPFLPFKENFVVSSISCGCEKDRPDCQSQECSQRLINESRICGILYQETDCRDCLHDGIILEDNETFTTKNSAVIRSLSVRSGCTITQTSFGFSGYDSAITKIQFNELASISARTLEPSYTRQGEEFYCNCLANPTTEVPSTSTGIDFDTSTTSDSETTTMDNYYSSTSTSTSTPPTLLEEINTKIALSVLIGMGGTVFIVVGIYLCFRRPRKILRIVDQIDGLDEMQLREFPVGSRAVDLRNVSVIPRSDIQIDFENELGLGTYGIVYKGRWNDTDVAVKITRPPSIINTEEHRLHLKSFMCEIRHLAYVGNHENIVRFLGACTENLERGSILILLELCTRGSLKEELKIMKHSHIQQNRKCVEYISFDDSLSPSKKPFNADVFHRLVNWSLQIATGMEYLSSKGLLHIDLAARNILLAEDWVAKISDLGLSRRLYGNPDYKKEGLEPIPFKTFALESLTRKMFTVKSDVWAFGVLLWEIFTLGDDPNNEFTTASLANFLASGERLPQPDYLLNHSNIYEKMYNCWNEDPQERPSFTELKDFLHLINITDLIIT